jgi:hypothetical protein
MHHGASMSRNDTLKPSEKSRRSSDEKLLAEQILR